MNKLIIQIKYGGLGDHLFFSHIPRIAKESGVKRVFISNASDYRDREYKTIIWAHNPYVDGFTNESGMDFKKLEEKVLSFHGNMNLLDRNMLALGLDDGKRWHEPELYLKKYQTNMAIKGMSLYDGNFISGPGAIQSIPPMTDFQMEKRGTWFGNGSTSIRSKTIYEYIDMILSCSRFSCVTSGQATLAAALGVKATCYYGEGQSKIFHHSKLHRYIKI